MFRFGSCSFLGVGLYGQLAGAAILNLVDFHFVNSLKQKKNPFTIKIQTVYKIKKKRTQDTDHQQCEAQEWTSLEEEKWLNFRERGLVIKHMQQWDFCVLPDLGSQRMKEQIATLKRFTTNRVTQDPVLLSACLTGGSSEWETPGCRESVNNGERNQNKVGGRGKLKAGSSEENERDLTVILKFSCFAFQHVHARGSLLSRHWLPRLVSEFILRIHTVEFIMVT